MYSLNDHSFEDIALGVFRFQAEHNLVYKQYLDQLGLNFREINSLSQVPFMPITFFRHHTVQSGTWHAETIFSSSGTTGMKTSRHNIRHVSHYLANARQCFEHFFGDLRQYHIMALLPGYLERPGSSLVTMIRHFIECSGSSYSGFYLHEVDQLLHDLMELRKDTKRKTILWGVTFALLDLAEQHAPDLSHCMVIETGGMKGRRKELTRQEMHQVLTRAFGVESIYSEYGMTELLSQAYSKGEGVFYCPPSMRMFVRDLTDPFDISNDGTGALNIIDLANHHSMSFIETEDIGKVLPDGSFEVMGRVDNSEIRGCNLMIE